MENEFANLVAIKEKIGRRSVGFAAEGPQIILGHPQDLFTEVKSICRYYLRKPGAQCTDITSLFDCDINWAFGEYINSCSAGIMQKFKFDDLILGLVAIAIIGDNCDPRDVLLWLRELYHAAEKHPISCLEWYFEKISSIASTKMHGSSYGHSSVAGKMKAYPLEAVFYKNTNSNFKAKCADRTIKPLPVMLAVIENNVNKISELILNREDLNGAQNGVSALALAAFANNKPAVEFLLESGANVNGRPFGLNFLEYVRLGLASGEIIELLKSAGAK